MKEFELTMLHRIEDKIKSIDKIEADNLLQLVCQFTMIAICIQKMIDDDYLAKLRGTSEDDIPF